MTDQGIVLWHQGALGDLLLAGPAFQAIRAHNPGASLIGLGHPERWVLLQDTLELSAVWDGSAALWAPLYAEQTPLPETLQERLAGVGLAVVFSPREPTVLLTRLQEAGAARAVWAPSFPEEGREPVAALQARRLAHLGIAYEPEPLRLTLDVEAWWPPEVSREKHLLAVAPGSGSPAKNWPLAHYYEVTRALAWEHGFQVVWLTGPAEEAWLPYLRGLAAAQEHQVLDKEPLKCVAAVLARTALYLGGDSGLTHLAAAAGARWVVALFGPTDPRVWAPLGGQVTVLAAPRQAADVPAATAFTWETLGPEQVLAKISVLLKNR